MDNNGGNASSKPHYTNTRICNKRLKSPHVLNQTCDRLLRQVIVEQLNSGICIGSKVNADYGLSLQVFIM